MNFSHCARAVLLISDQSDRRCPRGASVPCGPEPLHGSASSGLLSPPSACCPSVPPDAPVPDSCRCCHSSPLSAPAPELLLLLPAPPMLLLLSRPSGTPSSLVLMPRPSPALTSTSAIWLAFWKSLQQAAQDV